MESAACVPGPEARRPAWSRNREWGAGSTTPCVGDIMSKEVVTAAPGDTILSAAEKMAAQGLSCVVVVCRERVVGILTETDMLDLVAGGAANPHQVAVSERMSSPVDTIPVDTSMLEADRMMETRCLRRLPVLENGRLAGIVTQTDITRALLSLNSLGCVSDIMTKQVATVSADATVMEAARRMSCANLSCLVVMREEKTAGILTTKDLLRRIVALHKDPTQTRVLDVMSLPVATIPSHCSILDASRKMEDKHYHRLLVTDGTAICGIVTQTDIMRAVRRSREAVDSQQRILKEELADLLQHAIRDMQRVRDFLSDIPSRPTEADLPVSTDSPVVEPMVSCVASTSEGS